MSVGNKSPIEMQLDGLAWRPVEWEEKPADGIPYVTHEGELDIMGAKLRCYQLSDGRRVFDVADIEEFFAGNFKWQPCERCGAVHAPHGNTLCPL